MSSRPCLSFLVVLLSFVDWVKADEPLSLSVAGVARYALKNNPDLAAARWRIDEARGRLLQAGRLSNPALQSTFQQHTRGREHEVEVVLEQRFPVTARLRLEKSVSQSLIAAAEAELRNAERLLASQVQTLAVRWLALGERAKLDTAQLGNSKELLNFTEKRIGTGEASPVDAAQVRLEAQQIEAQALNTRLQRTSLMGELRPLLGVGPDALVEITGELVSPAASASGVTRPDLKAAEFSTQAAMQNTQLQKAARNEDIGIGLVMNHGRTEDAPEGLQNDTFLGLQFTIPLPFWNRNEGRIAEAEATARRLEAEELALKQRIASEAATARAERDAIARLLEAYDQRLVPEAQKLAGDMRRYYEAGQSSLTDALRARDRLLQLERERLDARRDLELARIREATATGSILSDP